MSAGTNGDYYFLHIRGAENTYITNGAAGAAWSISGEDVKCYGNIETLLDYTTVAAGEHPTIAGGCYKHMFCGWTSLTLAPSLPAITLANSCYYRMFNMCSSLTTVPALPATTLQDSCYYWMFGGCTHIKLSSTQTGEYTIAYRIPTTGTGTTAKNALRDMFDTTGGAYKGAPSINTTYYLSNTNTVVS